MPLNAATDVHAHEQPDREENDALKQSQRHTPASIPPSNATGRIGVSESLSKKPLSMSRARSAPAVIAPKSEA